MSTSIPTAADVRATLQALTAKQLQALSGLSGVPVTTLYNVRNGTTKDPRLDTVGAFMPHLDAVRAVDAQIETPQG